MSELKGYAGQLLDVDLSTGKTQAVPLDPQLVRDYIGGRALGIRMIMEEYGENYVDIDPLGEEAILAIMTGPYAAYGASKMIACFKSPMNYGMFGSAISGDTPSALKFAGYDGIIIRGKASKPVYLYIENDKVEIREAQHLWGLDVADTHNFLDKETPNGTEYLYISQAGENLVKFGAIMTNWYRACGRGGSGAVMGSKNLKAIAIQGTGPAPDVADMDTLMNYINVTADHGLENAYRPRGTVYLIYTNANGSSAEPIRNWQAEWHDEKQVQWQFFAAEQWVRRYWADYGCTAACSKLGRIKSGQYAGAITELPDYEAGAMVGTNLGIFDINSMSFLADLYDKVGADVIEGGTVLGFAGELYERGLLTAEDFDLGTDEEGNPIVPEWGNAKAFELLTYKITNRQGIGDVLADGVWQAALALSEQLGEDVTKYAVHVKGIGLGAHGVRSGRGGRAANGIGPIAYALETQGGDHGTTVMAVDNFRERTTVQDVVGACQFWSVPIPDETADQSTLGWLNAITGFGITEDELNEELVPRWVTLQRASTLLGGWTAEDDCNPDRWYEPLPDGPEAGKAVDPAEEKAMLREAYAFRGWDENGIPTSETLKKYGLEFLDAPLAKLRG